MARRRRRGRGRRTGFSLPIAPTAALVVAGLSILGPTEHGDGLLALKDGNFSGAMGSIKRNLETHWPVYLGLPIGIGIAGKLVKSMRMNPGVRLGGFRVAVF